MMRSSVFKTEAGRDKVRAYYTNVLSRFPFGQQYVETIYGKTFLLTAGQTENPPVVLLHGSGSNSAFWFPEIMALSAKYRVYAVDIIGEAGNSEEYRPDLYTDAFARWMKDVLDALGLTRAAFIGNSLGGWMALKFAAAYPACVLTLALIAPAGLAPVRPQFLLEAGRARQEVGTVKVTRDILGEQAIPLEVLDFMNLIAENYNPIQELPLFSNEELRRLRMPVLWLDGEDDAIINSQGSAQRLKSLVPEAQIHLLPGVGHVVFNAIEYILPFLAQAAQ